MAYRLSIKFKDENRPDFYTPVSAQRNWQEHWRPIIEAHKLDLLWYAGAEILFINRDEDGRHPLTVETLTQLEHELDVMQIAFEARTDFDPASLTYNLENIKRVREAISIAKQDIDAVERFYIG
ncbi:MAG: hypothetical protein KME04_17440 [Pleurocapsa minor GSE-CHR-MK-17-07R]|jgi:hypothetical protein|nr:hypothetical protein [Pleurocapsa minor GSE-CHR-MK 17-07R]